MLKEGEPKMQAPESGVETAREVHLSIVEAMGRMTPLDQEVTRGMVQKRPNFYGIRQNRRGESYDPLEVEIKIDGDEYLDFFRKCVADNTFISQFLDRFPKEFLEEVKSCYGEGPEMVEGRLALVRSFLGTRDHCTFKVKYSGNDAEMWDYFKQHVLAPQYKPDNPDGEAAMLRERERRMPRYNVDIPTPASTLSLPFSVFFKDGECEFEFQVHGQHAEGFPTGDGLDMQRYNEMVRLISELQNYSGFERLDIYPGVATEIQPQFRKKS